VFGRIAFGSQGVGDGFGDRGLVFGDEDSGQRRSSALNS
jgi:hypothetical protein